MPIVVLVVFSFNESRTGYAWGGLSLRWYEALFNNRAMVNAMWNSLWLALSAATVSTVIGALTALALHRYRFRGKKLLNGMLFVVMMSPEIVLAISLLALFLLVGLQLGYVSLAIVLPVLKEALIERLFFTAKASEAGCFTWPYFVKPC